MPSDRLALFRAIYQLCLGCLALLAVLLAGLPRAPSDWPVLILAIITFGQVVVKITSSRYGNLIRYYAETSYWLVRTKLRTLRGLKPKQCEVHVFPRGAVIQHLNPTHQRKKSNFNFDLHEFNPKDGVRKVYWVNAADIPLVFSRGLEIHPNPVPEEQERSVVLLPFHGSSPQPFDPSQTRPSYLAAFFRQDEWTEAEVTTIDVPAGLYTVYWYFKLVDGGVYDRNNNPWAYPDDCGYVHVPSLPVHLELKAGLRGTHLYSNDARRDEKVVLEDEGDHLLVNWASPSPIPLHEVSDEENFPCRVAHPLHHRTYAPIVLHMFEYNPGQVTGRFVWGGCKIVPARGLAGRGLRD
ncbi:hypothetical protein BCR39DRAFT_535564 [Naematelia encephala]|uniref:Uncharacterized protein n=1 Tax=Naematelia encephala TaxID=71784 RepID=A0A1Y2B0W5_9TREE|nr:hypothetical protein BCR39DRAFT_535564 [Naematelia encephala]